MKQAMNDLAARVHELEAELVNTKQGLAEAMNNAYELEAQNIALKEQLHQDGVNSQSPSPTKK